MPEEELMKIGVRVPVTLHLEVKSEAPRQRLSMEDAYREALVLWLAKYRGIQQRKDTFSGSKITTENFDKCETNHPLGCDNTSSVAESHREWISILIEVLGSDNTVAIDAMTTNLIAYRSLIRTVNNTSEGASANDNTVSGGEVKTSTQLAIDELEKFRAEAGETLQGIQREAVAMRKAFTRTKRNAS